MSTPFTSILCGVEGNESSTEAARQAVELAKPGADLHFMAVYTSFELGEDTHKDTLQDSLVDAAGLAADAGVSASTEIKEAKYAIDALLPSSEKHDLLVLGTHGSNRVSGILFGSTASEAAHGTDRPLLISRPAGAAESFLTKVLLASDGSPGSWAPTRAAAGIAATFGSNLEVVHVEDGKHPDADAVLDAQLAEIGNLTGGRPTLRRRDGNATQGIIEIAKESGTSLIVSGRRGLRGIKALGSVSERIVSGAGCSVLLIPAGEGA
jgi:nucleotide-binding universal stress UspA family protein